MSDLTERLSGFYKQKKIYKTLLNVVEPVKVEIGKTLTIHRSEEELNEKSHFSYYIPMKESVNNLLSIVPYQSLSSSMKVTGDLKNDIFDGEEIKNLTKNENRLAFAFYVDDVEVVNPIGAHKKKHKLSITLNIKLKLFLKLFFRSSFILLGIA